MMRTVSQRMWCRLGMSRGAVALVAGGRHSGGGIVTRRLAAARRCSTAAAPFASSFQNYSASSDRLLIQEEEARRRSSVVSCAPSRRIRSTRSTTTLTPTTTTTPTRRLSIHHTNKPDGRFFSSVSSSSQEAEEDTTSSTTTTTTIPFLLADIGEGIKEVELLQWFVQEGDHVHQFDNVCQVQSDKATVDISSRYDGFVVDLAGLSVGDMVAVGSPLLHIAVASDSVESDSSASSSVAAEKKQPEEETSTAPPPVTKATTSTSTDTSSSSSSSGSSSSESKAHPIPSAPPAPEPAAVQQNATNDNTPKMPLGGASSSADAAVSLSSDSDTNTSKAWMSPAVRRLCKEYGLDPSRISGTGPDGRILKADVLRQQEQQEQPVGDTTTPTTTAATAATDDDDDDNIVQLRGYTRLMNRTMTESLQIPHMVLGEELDVTQLLQLRQQLNNNNSNSVPKISLLAMLLKACSVALTDYPLVNATQHGPDPAACQVRLQPHHHLGVAMDTNRGLVVPVIPNCQDLSIVEIQVALNRFKEHAAADGILAEDLAVPPTFTLSNIGALGAGVSLQPVLAPPQLAMGAMGRLQRLPRFVDNPASNTNDDKKNDNDNLTVVPVDILPISWAADHRFLDGATLARFHVKVQQLVGDPLQMLIHLK